MKKKFALIIVDMINDFDFPKGRQLAEFTHNIIPSILTLKKALPVE